VADERRAGGRRKGMQLGLLLFNPRRFFDERVASSPERMIPSVFIAMGIGLSAFAEMLAYRDFNDTATAIAFVIIAAVFAVGLSPVVFVLCYWLPVRIVAGSPARPWESGGYSLAPPAIGGFLMVLLAWVAPSGGDPATVPNVSVLYAVSSPALMALFSIWSLFILYQALLVHVLQQRARFAIAACILASAIANGLAWAAA